MKKITTMYDFVKEVSELKQNNAIENLCNTIKWYSIYYKKDITRELILKVYKLNKKHKLI